MMASMKHKTATLEGALLDQAVALAEGWCLMPHGGGWCEPREVRGIGEERIDCSVFHPQPLPWSTDWQHGGPIIERERIELCVDYPNEWSGRKDSENDFRKMTWQYSEYYGPTALVAAMRAWVASKFGDEVELP